MAAPRCLRCLTYEGLPYYTSYLYSLHEDSSEPIGSGNTPLAQYRSTPTPEKTGVCPGITGTPAARALPHPASHGTSRSHPRPLFGQQGRRLRAIG